MGTHPPVLVPSTPLPVTAWHGIDGFVMLFQDPAGNQIHAPHVNMDDMNEDKGGAPVRMVMPRDTPSGFGTAVAAQPPGAMQGTTLHDIPPAIVRTFLARFLTPHELCDFTAANRRLLGAGHIIQLLTTLRNIQRPFKRLMAVSEKAQLDHRQAPMWKRVTSSDALANKLNNEIETAHKVFVGAWDGSCSRSTAQILRLGRDAAFPYQPLFDCIPFLNTCKERWDCCQALQAKVDSGSLADDDVKVMLSLALTFGENRVARETADALKDMKSAGEYRIPVLSYDKRKIDGCMRLLNSHILEQAGESMMGIQQGFIWRAARQYWSDYRPEPPTTETQTLDTDLPERGAPLTQADRVTGELMTALPFEVTPDQQRYRFTHVDGTVVIVQCGLTFG